MEVVESELLLHFDVVAENFEVAGTLLQEIVLVHLLHLLSHFQGATVIVEESFEMTAELGQVVAALENAGFVVEDGFDESLVDGLT